MLYQETEHHPLLAGGRVRPESQVETLQEEIREEAFRIYTTRLAAGRSRSPQDDWMEAKAVVLARHAGESPGEEFTP